MSDRPDADSFALAASMAARWMAAYNADDAPEVERMLVVLGADPRGLLLSFTALTEMFIATMEKLHREGWLEGDVQPWLDRYALNHGARADEVIARYQGKGQ
jgi:hypothetical protein